MPDLILSIDQGTSSTKALLVDLAGTVVARASAPLAQQSPQPGWVEHIAADILDSVRAAVAAVMQQAPGVVVAVGISNQRESMVLWNRLTGEAVSPVLSWQDRRTVDRCASLVAAGHGDTVRRISGLPLDPMFSAVKAAWLMDSYGDSGDPLCLGTIDSWLAWHLVGEHVIEAGNASRTSLLDLATGDWSPELLGIFGIPPDVLPRVVPSAQPVGTISGLHPDVDGAPLTGILGDSHAALFAHAGWRPGLVKATYGTGSSIMTLASGAPGDSPGLCRTIAWQLPNEHPAVAWEANILSAGSTLAWLATVLGTTPEALAAEATADSGGVAFVPAFNGLGAPWWDSGADALIVGMSLATTRGDLARAALDSVAFQVSDVVSTLMDSGVAPTELVVDGAMTANRTLMQRQADLCHLRVMVSSTAELSALGAAHAAGLGLGVWTLHDLEAMSREYLAVDPGMSQTARLILLELWHQSLARSLTN